MIAVSDSSPLISLAILNKIDILSNIFDEIFIPLAVYKEITQQNKPYSEELLQFSLNRVRQVHNLLAVQILQKELDVGESEVIVLAKENNIHDVLIDEYKGRKLAKVYGLSPIGTIGVLLQAKKIGLIKEVRPELDKLIANHRRISRPLYKKAMEMANEIIE